MCKHAGQKRDCREAQRYVTDSPRIISCARIPAGFQKRLHCVPDAARRSTRLSTQAQASRSRAILFDGTPHFFFFFLWWPDQWGSVGSDFLLRCLRLAWKGWPRYFCLDCPLIDELSLDLFLGLNAFRTSNKTTNKEIKLSWGSFSWASGMVPSGRPMCCMREEKN